ncbi:hypothetical protein BC828DRAFT_391537 [Blastocladiella britannica]|nr:hypothetical protein BC828DRAFT_391537 [Blastocladiella britannica]
MSSPPSSPTCGPLPSCSPFGSYFARRRHRRRRQRAAAAAANAANATASSATVTTAGGAEPATKNGPALLDPMAPRPPPSPSLSDHAAAALMLAGGGGGHSLPRRKTTRGSSAYQFSSGVESSSGASDTESASILVTTDDDEENAEEDGEDDGVALVNGVNGDSDSGHDRTTMSGSGGRKGKESLHRRAASWQRGPPPPQRATGDMSDGTSESSGESSGSSSDSNGDHVGGGHGRTRRGDTLGRATQASSPLPSATPTPTPAPLNLSSGYALRRARRPRYERIYDDDHRDLDALVNKLRLLWHGVTSSILETHYAQAPQSMVLALYARLVDEHASSSPSSASSSQSSTPYDTGSPSSGSLGDAGGRRSSSPSSFALLAAMLQRSEVPPELLTGSAASSAAGFACDGMWLPHITSNGGSGHTPSSSSASSTRSSSASLSSASTLRAVAMMRFGIMAPPLAGSSNLALPPLMRAGTPSTMAASALSSSASSMVSSMAAAGISGQQQHLSPSTVVPALRRTSSTTSLVVSDPATTHALQSAQYLLTHHLATACYRLFAKLEHMYARAILRRLLAKPRDSINIALITVPTEVNDVLAALKAEAAANRASQSSSAGTDTEEDDNVVGMRRRGGALSRPLSSSSLGSMASWESLGSSMYGGGGNRDDSFGESEVGDTENSGNAFMHSSSSSTELPATLLPDWLESVDAAPDVRLTMLLRREFAGTTIRLLRTLFAAGLDMAHAQRLYDMVVRSVRLFSYMMTTEPGLVWTHTELTGAHVATDGSMEVVNLPALAAAAAAASNASACNGSATFPQTSTTAPSMDDTTTPIMRLDDLPPLTVLFSVAPGLVRETAGVLGHSQCLVAERVYAIPTSSLHRTVTGSSSDSHGYTECSGVSPSGMMVATNGTGSVRSASGRGSGLRTSLTNVVSVSASDPGSPMASWDRMPPNVSPIHATYLENGIHDTLRPADVHLRPQLSVDTTGLQTPPASMSRQMSMQLAPFSLAQQQQQQQQQLQMQQYQQQQQPSPLFAGYGSAAALPPTQPRIGTTRRSPSQLAITAAQRQLRMQQQQPMYTTPPYLVSTVSPTHGASLPPFPPPGQMMGSPHASMLGTPTSATGAIGSGALQPPPGPRHQGSRSALLLAAATAAADMALAHTSSTSSTSPSVNGSSNGGGAIWPVSTGTLESDLYGAGSRVGPGPGLGGGVVVDPIYQDMMSQQQQQQQQAHRYSGQLSARDSHLWATSSTTAADHLATTTPRFLDANGRVSPLAAFETSAAQPSQGQGQLRLYHSTSISSLGTAAGLMWPGPHQQQSPYLVVPAQQPMGVVTTELALRPMSGKTPPPIARRKSVVFSVGGESSAAEGNDDDDGSSDDSSASESESDSDSSDEEGDDSNGGSGYGQDPYTTVFPVIRSPLLKVPDTVERVVSPQPMLTLPSPVFVITLDSLGSTAAE